MCFDVAASGVVGGGVFCSQSAAFRGFSSYEPGLSSEQENRENLLPPVIGNQTPLSGRQPGRLANVVLQLSPSSSSLFYIQT